MNPAQKHPWLNRREAYRLLRRGDKLCHLAALSLALACAFTFVALGGPPHHGYQATATSRYIGNDKCLSCHQDQKTYRDGPSPHFSSGSARFDYRVKFGPGENILKTSEPELHYRMEARKDGFYQTAVLGTPPDTASISERFDLVIGSGRKGQTYLYWGKGDRLSATCFLLDLRGKVGQ